MLLLSTQLVCSVMFYFLCSIQEKHQDVLQICQKHLILFGYLRCVLYLIILIFNTYFTSLFVSNRFVALIKTLVSLMLHVSRLYIWSNFYTKLFDNICLMDYLRLMIHDRYILVKLLFINCGCKYYFMTPLFVRFTLNPVCVCVCVWIESR